MRSALFLLNCICLAGQRGFHGGWFSRGVFFCLFWVCFVWGGRGGGVEHGGNVGGCLCGCGLFFICCLWGVLCMLALTEERQPLHSSAMRVEVPGPLLFETEIMGFFSTGL